MKRILFIAVAFFCSVSLADPVSKGSFPRPLVVAVNNGSYSFKEHEGKVVLLDFWASWCGPCRQSFPWMNGLQRQYGKENLEIIAINLDADREDANTFLAEVPAEFQILYDQSGKSAELMGVQGMPMSYLIDRQGNVHSSLIGFSPRRAASHEHQINTLIEANYVLEDHQK